MQRSIRRLAAVLTCGFVAVALGLTYWQVIRAPDLVYGDYNPRLAKEEAQIQRGSILDRNGQQLAYSRATASGSQRYYTDPTMAQVTGYYSALYGSSGLESSFAKFLRGDVQANPADTVTSDLLHRPRVGADLHTTLDGKIQAAAAQIMGSDKGAIVAIDPSSGAIRAMVSVPYYDPNKLEEGWKSLSSDPNRPLLNRATQGLYTPGSVFKIITATAAIDLGLVDLNKHYTCTQDLVVDGFRIVNKNHPGVSDVTYVDDFAYSCNVTFAKTGLGLGTNPLPVGDDLPNPPPWANSIDESRTRFEDYAHRFGLDSPLPFDLPTSTSRIGNENLSRVELANTAFGQGELQVTPLLMALATATVANGGKMPEPYLVQEIRDPAGSVLMSHSPQTVRQVMTPETARSMNRLMTTSVQEGYAKPAQISGIQVGGKTGSAEVGPDQKTHSWFIGYAPADHPVIAVAVIMENKGSGSDFATPAGRKVIEAALGR
jgi:penicillin-binding protein A